MTIISKITIGYLEAPLKHPFVTALRRVDSAKDLVVALHSENGKIGYGSTAAVKQVTGQSLESLYQELTENILDKAIPWLNEHRPEPEAFSDYLRSLGLDNPSACTALEIAYYDVYAKDQGKALPDLLGASLEPFKTCYTVSLGTDDQMINQAKEAVESGFTRLKVKLGSEKIETDINITKKILESLPSKVSLYIDANQAWELSQAKKYISELSKKKLQERIVLIEQPLAKDKIDELSSLTSESQIPIFLDESVFNLENLEKAISQKACKGVVIKLLKTGGFKEAFQMAEICEKNNVSVLVSSMLETKLGVYASLLFAASLKIPPLLDLDAAYLAKEDVFEGGFTQDAETICLEKSPVNLEGLLGDEHTVWTNLD